MPKIKFAFLLLLISVLISCQKDLPFDKDFLTMKECTLSSTTKLDKAVILVLGQSNAANYGDKKYFASCEKLSNFYNGELYPLKDPLKGADGTGGSVWSRMAEQLHENGFAEEIIIAPAAAGGSSIQQWIPGGDLNPFIVSTIQSLEKQNIEITHILWHQGESNNSANVATTDSENNAVVYQENFLTLTQQIRSLGVDAPIFIAMATRCAHLDIDLDLQQAQQGLANADLGIYLGPNTDLLGNEYRYDDCHFNAEGLKIHSLLWTEILLKH